MLPRCLHDLILSLLARSRVRGRPVQQASAWVRPAHRLLRRCSAGRELCQRPEAFGAASTSISMLPPPAARWGVARGIALACQAHPKRACLPEPAYARHSYQPVCGSIAWPTQAMLPPAVPCRRVGQLAVHDLPLTEQRSERFLVGATPVLKPQPCSPREGKGGGKGCHPLSLTNSRGFVHLAVFAACVWIVRVEPLLSGRLLPM